MKKINFKSLKMPAGKTKTTIIWVVIAIAVLFFGSLIYKFVKKVFGLLNSPFSNGEEQAEHTANLESDIQTQVSAFNWGSLPHPKTYYMDKAEGQFTAMQYSGTDFTSLINGVATLSANELEAVFLCYGIRSVSTFGVTDSIGKNLIGAYADELSTWSLWGATQREQMQTIWDKTGRTI